MKRTFGEWADFLYYVPAALDGGLTLIVPDLRDDVAALWQLLMLICFSTKQRPWYTVGELKVIWVHCIRQLAVHLDALGRAIHAELAEIGAADVMRQRMELQSALARVAAQAALARAYDDQDDVGEQDGLHVAGVEENKEGGADPWAHLCFGLGIGLPFNADSKTKLHLAYWPVS